MKTMIATLFKALVEKGSFTFASIEFDKFPQLLSKDYEALKADSLKTYEAIQFDIEKVETV